MSFEKYLRESKRVEIRDGSGRSRRLLAGGRTVGEYEDDDILSVTGFLVRKLRALYPEADPLKSSPLVQVVRGVDVGAVIDGYDLPAVSADYLALTGADQQFRAGFIDDYNNAIAAVADGTAEPVVNYLLFQQLQTMAVLARSEDLGLVEGTPYPFCSEDESTKFFMGMIEERSFRWVAKRPIPPSLRTCFVELYPDGYWDGNDFIRGVKKSQIA